MVNCNCNTVRVANLFSTQVQNGIKITVQLFVRSPSQPIMMVNLLIVTKSQSHNVTFSKFRVNISIYQTIGLDEINLWFKWGKPMV